MLADKVLDTEDHREPSVVSCFILSTGINMHQADDKYRSTPASASKVLCQ